MKNSELLDLINAVEVKFPVDKWELYGIRVWPLIRFNIYFENAFLGHYSFMNKKASSDSKKRFIYYKKILSSLSFKDFKISRGKMLKRNVVFLSNGVSNIFLQGSWYDKFCDPLADCLKDAGISSLLLSPGLHHFEPKYNQCIYIQILQDLAKIQALGIELFRFGNASQEIDGFNDFIDFLKAQGNLVHYPKIQNIRKRTLKLKTLASYYKFLLKIVKPKIVFLVSYYGDGMAMNLACRNLGIVSIDIQHGRQGEEHVGYGRFCRVPRDGYELLPSYFWCWGTHEAEVIDFWGGQVKHHHKPLVGGDLFLDFFKLSKLPSMAEYEEKILNIQQPENSKTHILYTLNGLESDVYLEQLLDVVEQGSESFFWWIRSHPCRKEQIKNILKIIERRQLSLPMNIVEASNLPLYLILKNVDIHVTEISSTVLEALQFDISSIILGQEGAKIFSEQISSGWAIHVPNLTFLKSALINQKNCLGLKRKDCAQNLHDSDVKNPAMQFVLSQFYKSYKDDLG